mgnify:CR=1 FL=1
MAAINLAEEFKTKIDERFKLGSKTDSGAGHDYDFDGTNGIPVPGSPSANKRLYMLLRWMVRKNSPVDFGIWNNILPDQLIIPLDTHVYQTAVKLGITNRRSADLKTATEITSAMAEIWPDDPARGDFALYGIGINPEL